MAMYALTPSACAANDTAAAWLPDELVAMPRARSSAGNDNKALKAPRTLKTPLLWKFSHLKETWHPNAVFRVVLVRIGVRWMYDEIR